MSIEEIRTIKEKMSLEAVGMNANELHSYYSKGAREIQKMINEVRSEIKPMKVLSNE